MSITPEILLVMSRLFAALCEANLMPDCLWSYGSEESGRPGVVFVFIHGKAEVEMHIHDDCVDVSFDSGDTNRAPWWADMGCDIDSLRDAVDSARRFLIGDYIAPRSKGNP